MPVQAVSNSRLAHCQVAKLARFCGAIVTSRSESTYVDTSLDAVYFLKVTNQAIINVEVIGVAVGFDCG